MAPEDTDTPPPSRLGVLERVTLIVDCLAESPGRLLLEEVTQITGLPRSTTFRLLRNLADLGWVDHNAEGYGVGPRLAHSGYSDYEELRSAAGPVLNELAAATNLVAHLGVLQGGFVHYLDKIGGGTAASVPSQIGTRIRASEGSCGLAILACLSQEEVEATLLHTGAEILRPLSAIHADLQRARRRGGVAFMDGSTRASTVSSLGAPILGPKGPVAAVALARRGPLQLETHGPLVAQAARTIAARLFGA